MIRRPPVPSVIPSDNGSTKYQRRQPATWKRSMNSVKRSYSSRPQVLAWYKPKSMRESTSRKNRRNQAFQLPRFSSSGNRSRKFTLGDESGSRLDETVQPVANVVAETVVLNYGLIATR